MKEMTKGWPIQAFRLGADTIEAVSQEEVDATYSDMLAMGLAQPPYEEFDIIISPLEAAAMACGDSAKERREHSKLMKEVKDQVSFMAARVPMAPLGLRYKNGVPTAVLRSINQLTNKFAVDFEVPPSQREPAFMLRVLNHTAPKLIKLLIVLLATKNASKEVRECKSAKLGVGKGKHAYTTTIRVGEVTEYAEGAEGAEPNKTGATIRPHLRRGHKRHQHYGPHGNYIKQIFIQPVFVNADGAWIDARTAYNVSLPKD